MSPSQFGSNSSSNNSANDAFRINDAPLSAQQFSTPAGSARGGGGGGGEVTSINNTANNNAVFSPNYTRSLAALALASPSPAAWAAAGGDLVSPQKALNAQTSLALQDSSVSTQSSSSSSSSSAHQINAVHSYTPAGKLDVAPLSPARAKVTSAQSPALSPPFLSSSNQHNATSSAAAKFLTVGDATFLTFQLFSNIICKHHLYVFFAMDSGALAPYYAVFDGVFRQRQPALAQWLNELGIQPEMYLFGWLQTVFLKALPFGIAARIWDAFLLDGVPLLFRTSLAILDLLSPALLDSGSGENTGAGFEVCVNVLTRARSSVHVWDRYVTGSSEPDADGALLMKAIDAVVLPHDALIEIEDIQCDPFFFRHVSST